MTKQDKKLPELLQYAKRGWKIFPLKANGKTPLTGHGHKDATNNPARIKEWHEQYPDANWGVATGKASGFFAIDIDVKNGKQGLESWKGLKKPFHKLHRTLSCDTATGGRHYYYLQPDNISIGCSTGLMDGIDIKGDGGYPAIAQQGLSMLCARRGIGKTQLATELAYGAAMGVSCLGGRFKVDRPFKVIYVDGEMPARSLQERFVRISKGHNGKLPQPDYLRIVTPDLQERGIPDLATPQGQDAIEMLLGNTDLVILDNLSSLCRRGKENESESWLPIQEWVLKLRSKGTAIMFVHHAGKKGDPRGTSRREDVLDTIISLKHPNDYKASQGARFIVKYEKSREVYGEQVEEFELWLKTDGETTVWETPQIDEEKASLEEKIIELHLQQKSYREIEFELGVGKTKVGEVIKEWQKKNREADNDDE